MSFLPKATSPADSVGAIRAVLLAMLVATLLGSFATSAAASTVLKLDLESLVANSEEIVHGEVASVTSKIEDGKVYTYTEIAVTDGLKGTQSGQTVTVKQLGGRTDELATWVPGVPHFEAGERIIAFLEKPAPDAFAVVTGMSQGKFRVAVGPDNTTPYVVPYLGDLALIEPVTLQADDVRTAGQTSSQAGVQGGNYQAAKPADLYQRVVPLDVFKQQVRAVIRGQEDE